MEIGTREGYSLWAKTYDSEKNPLIAAEEPEVGRLLEGLSYSRVLDAGAGTGRYALRLARQGARVSAIDDCPEMLSVAAERSAQENLDIDFRLRSIEDRLPFYRATFDLVICSLTLTHIPCLEETVLEFHRVLRPGGHLLITDFHPDSVQFGWRTEFVKEDQRYQLPNMPYTRLDYIRALKSTAFSIVEDIDIPLRSVPPGYLSQDEVIGQGHVNFCIIILARKGNRGCPDG